MWHNEYCLTEPSGGAKTLKIRRQSHFYSKNIPPHCPVVDFSQLPDWKGPDLKLPAPGYDAGLSDFFLIDLDQETAVFQYDVLGFCFWMMTRQEEKEAHLLDEHDRFLSIHSHAHEHNYLHRPIVDEWFEVLGVALQKLMGNLRLTEPVFKMLPSHDVDTPASYQFMPVETVGRSVLSSLLKQGDMVEAWRCLYQRFSNSSQLHASDKVNTFDWIVSLSDRNNLVSAFYFVCGRTSDTFDPAYSISSRPMVSLLKSVSASGHEIGLHPSYHCYKNEQLIRSELNNLKSICAANGLSDACSGVRMHYLRWAPETLSLLDKAGFTYDTTLGYADRAGFRCGTCFEFPGFDSETNKIMNIRVRPLIAMEVSVFSEKYMGLDAAEGADVLRALKGKCRAVGGQFTLLWHNDRLASNPMREIYRNVIQC